MPKEPRPRARQDPLCSLEASSRLLPSEELQERIEHGAADLDPSFVVAVGDCDARDERRDARNLRACELAVLDVDVVDDLRDGREARLSEIEPLHERLERARVADGR